MVGSLQMWRTDCMHWSKPFYIGDLSIKWFWYPLGFWTIALSIPRDILSFGETNLCMDLQLFRGWHPSVPHCSRINCILYQKVFCYFFLLLNILLFLTEASFAIVSVHYKELFFFVQFLFLFSLSNCHCSFFRLT